MGKFGSNRSNNRGFGGSRRNSGDGESRSEGRGGYNNRRGGSGGGGGYGRGRRNDNDDALKLGDISVSEKVAEELGDQGLDDLRDAGVSAYVKVYPPKGVDEITIKRGDYINIRICKSKHGKERTIGFMTVTSNE